MSQTVPVTPSDIALLIKLIVDTRNSRSMSLEQLSDKTGIGMDILSEIESGELEIPEFSTYMLIARALKIPLEYALERYLEVEQNPELLLGILAEATSHSLPTTMIEKIAATFLKTERETAEEAAERLYSFTAALDNNIYKIALFNVISKFTDDHSIRLYWAKSLFQIYLIKRQNFNNLHEAYEEGKNILLHAQYLHIDEQIDFYYKLAAHASHLMKYKDSIEFSEKMISLDKTESVYKAYVIISTSYCYYLLERYDKAEEYIKLLEIFKFSFVKVNVDFMIAKLNGKKGNIDLAILQLKECLKNYPYKVTVMDDLLELYLEQKNLCAIEELFHWESYFVDVDSSSEPSVVVMYANYYAKKSEYFDIIQDYEQSLQCLLKVITMFISVGRHQDALKYIGKLLSYLNNTSDKLEKAEIANNIKLLSDYLIKIQGE
jgi:transcriptional regulator with XRE-family HTH domain